MNDSFEFLHPQDAGLLSAVFVQVQVLPWCGFATVMILDVPYKYNPEREPVPGSMS